MGHASLWGEHFESEGDLKAHLRPFVERYVRVALQGAPQDRSRAPIGLLRALQRFEQWPGSVDSLVTALTDELVTHFTRRNEGGNECDETRKLDFTDRG
jgi:hypothetical protein